MKAYIASVLLVTSVSITSTSLSAASEAPIPESVRSAFYPYVTGTLQQPGIIPGLTVDQQNWRVAEKVLPGEILHLVQVGDFAITVQETTDLPARPAYVDATTKYFHTVSLNGGYKIDNYKGGRPFPIIDPTDPRAGEKVAWNFRYRDVPDTMEMRGTMQGVSNSGTIDRSNVGRMRVRYGTDRVGDEVDDPQWAARGVRVKALFESLTPSDQEGNMRITTLYNDERQAADDLSYSPQNRRTRKGYVNMHTRMGGGRYDVLSEEQPPFFFIGYLHEYNWVHKGEHVMLVPGFAKIGQLTFAGKNNWYPNLPWELRRVIALESTPKGQHPYSKRIFYLDAQTYSPFYVLSYDFQGVLARLSLIVHGNPDFIPASNGIRLPVPLGASWVNFAQERASQMIVGQPAFDQNFSPRRFELMELLRRGK